MNAVLCWLHSAMLLRSSSAMVPAQTFAAVNSLTELNSVAINSLGLLTKAKSSLIRQARPDAKAPYIPRNPDVAHATILDSIKSPDFHGVSVNGAAPPTFVSNFTCFPGIGCILRNVCLVQHSHDPFPGLLYWGDATTLPDFVKTVPARWYGKPPQMKLVMPGGCTKNEGPCLVNRATIPWKAKAAAVVDLEGGENFGHHMLDIWFQVFRLLSMGNEQHQFVKDAIHVVHETCLEKKFGIPELPHAPQTCDRIYHSFSAVLQIGETLSMTKTHQACFADLRILENQAKFLDSPKNLRNLGSAAEFEEYHNVILQGKEKKGGSGTLLMVKQETPDKLAMYDKYHNGEQPMTSQQVAALSEGILKMACNAGRKVHLMMMPSGDAKCTS
eukprot:gnl/MRDRNA2_/MRDRNA2_84645_c0_seq1.p1 gnl/MRDRNA2_/MRDRNA2_84645_c0~~gnl/MRDRNA2_/MRDRNA2_84645_c0_seq1.p1  ORF type:complete len:386 (+),score=62.60 gnl/MRDRNA2_/MRDRNA2_84645_c0_seq1:133-1290(+)